MMARKKEPCPFCEDEHYTNDEFHGIQLSTEVYPDNMLIGIAATGTAEDGTYVELKQDIQMNYCPLCGRKCGW